MNKSFHLFEELLAENLVSGLIARADMLPPLEAKFDNVVREKTRISELRWIYRQDDRFADVYRYVRDKFFEANRFFNVDFIEDKFPLQYTTYYGNANGHYDWHQDVKWPTQNTGYDRKLSFILQLSDSDEYEGGDFEFQHARGWDAKQFRQRGKMIVFPSVMYHRVAPVTAGIRKSLVSWIEGPPWR
jgi:PKHD-type hydroxylase